MAKRIQFFFLLIFVFICGKTIVFADLAPDVPWNSSCNSNEDQYICETIQRDYSSPPLSDGCALYKNDARFRVLTYDKGFANDIIIFRSKYCIDKKYGYTPPATIIPRELLPAIDWKRTFLFGLMTFFVELPIVWLFKVIRSVKSGILFLCINLVSMTMLTLIMSYLYFNKTVSLAIGELMVFVVEALCSVLLFKNISQNRIVLVVFVANLFSLTLSLLVDYLIFGFL